MCGKGMRADSCHWPPLVSVASFRLSAYGQRGGLLACDLTQPTSVTLVTKTCPLANVYFIFIDDDKAACEFAANRSSGTETARAGKPLGLRKTNDVIPVALICRNLTELNLNAAMMTAWVVILALLCVIARPAVPQQASAGFKLSHGLQPQTEHSQCTVEPIAGLLIAPMGLPAAHYHLCQPAS